MNRRDGVDPLIGAGVSKHNALYKSLNCLMLRRSGFNWQGLLTVLAAVDCAIAPGQLILMALAWTTLHWTICPIPASSQGS